MGASGPEDGGDEYSAGSYLGDSLEAGPVPGDQADPGFPGLAGDPLVTSITDGEEVGGLETDDALASSGLAHVAGLPEAEAVPF